MEKLYAERAAALMRAREALDRSPEPDDDIVNEADDDISDRPRPVAAEYKSAGFELLRY